MNELLISNGTPLPEETIVSKVGIVGMSGSGKTQTARKLAESMLEVNQHIAVLDPTGAWWGLRSSADGLEEGFPIVVFGGAHGDTTLRSDAGAMLGHSLVKERFNAIFDMSKFNDAEIRRFSTDFLNAVYIRNRHPLHIFMDEFDIICPQAKAANSEEARAAVNTTVRRGRLKGIGSTMITQNPQDADKSVLNMADTVIAMRTQGSQAINAIGKWMGRNLAKAQLGELMSTLPELKTGTGWIWAPQSKTFAVVQFLLCKTFDSGKTPRLGESITPPKVLATVDIQKLGERITAEAEKSREESPEFLRQRIAELTAEIAKGGTEKMAGLQEHIAALEAQAAEVPTLRQEIDVLRRRHEAFFARLHNLIVEFGSSEVYLEAKVEAPGAAAVALPRQVAETSVHVRDLLEGSPANGGDVNAPKLRILNAIATLHAIRGANVTVEWIACTAGTTPRSRGFEENMRQLKGMGLVDGIRLTEQGRQIAKADATPARFREVIGRLSTMLSTPQVNILLALKGKRTTATTLATQQGTTERSRGFEENIRQLRKRDLIVFSGGHYSLVSWLEALA